MLWIPRTPFPVHTLEHFQYLVCIVFLPYSIPLPSSSWLVKIILNTVFRCFKTIYVSSLLFLGAVLYLSLLLYNIQLWWCSILSLVSFLSVVIPKLYFPCHSVVWMGVVIWWEESIITYGLVSSDTTCRIMVITSRKCELF